MDLQALQIGLATAGYIPRRGDLLAVASALTPGASRVFLLEGAPGCGKTALGEAVARMLNVPVVFYQCHAWSDADELFSGVDVASAVAGDAAHVRQDGILAIAARHSYAGQVVLIIDEVDKTSERTEALLLDYLQSGRVPVQPGVHLQTKLENVIVFFTSNAVRPLGDAFLRRVRRVRMSPLPVAVMDKIIQRRTGADMGVVTIASKACREIAEAEGNAALSLQEIANCIIDLVNVAQSSGDVAMILSQWAARTTDGANHKCSHVAALWAEVKRHKK